VGFNESAKRGEKKSLIAASRYQQHAIQTHPSYAPARFSTLDGE
jgi:hypothetical protein